MQSCKRAKRCCWHSNIVSGPCTKTYQKAWPQLAYNEIAEEYRQSFVKYLWKSHWNGYAFIVLCFLGRIKPIRISNAHWRTRIISWSLTKFNCILFGEVHTGILRKEKWKLSLVYFPAIQQVKMFIYLKFFCKIEGIYYDSLLTHSILSGYRLENSTTIRNVCLERSE